MSKLTVKQIPSHLEQLAVEALASLGVEDRPKLAAPPSAEMGDLGFPCFPYARAMRRSPQQIAAEVVAALEPKVASDPVLASVNATGPYVNFVIDYPKALAMVLAEVRDGGQGFGSVQADPEAAPVLIEYSSPNTNKPQHLGHIRNNLLGQAVATILAHQGRPVVRVNLINDRGIHICKSMLAYMRHGEGTDPEQAGKKGDHLIGDFYVRFNQEFEAEYAAWLESDEATEVFATWRESRDGKKAVQGWKKAHAVKGQPTPEPDDAQVRGLFNKGYKDAYFNAQSAIGAATRKLLVQWEEGDAQVRALWRQLNDWVEHGFSQTYERMGIHFDQIDHESQTYLLGKDIVQSGLDAGVFTHSENGAVVFDLAQMGLEGEKAVLRPDGTSLYVTQDLGTAAARFDHHKPQQMIYVVGDEQQHYFQVMFGIFGKLRPEAQGRMHHLSYGMVNLPHGRMKSREGTVVDADDLMDEMHKLAYAEIQARHPDLDEDEKHRRAEIGGLAALRYFLLDFSPQTTMTFDPEQSLEFTGRTGPYCMYSYVRTASILREVGGAEAVDFDAEGLRALDSELEVALIRELVAFPTVVAAAADQLDPSKITEYAFRLSKALASFFADRDHHVLGAATPEKRAARLQLMVGVNRVIKEALTLLGIHTLEHM